MTMNTLRAIEARSRSRVVGIGAVTGYGWGREHLWSGLLSGKPAASLRPGFGRNESDAGWVVQVPPGGFTDDGPTRFSRALRWTVREAVDDARARGWNPGATVGVVHACVLGDLDMYPMVAPGAAGYSGRQYLGVTPSTPISLVMAENGFHGPAMNVSAMCTSGVAATITASAWIESGLVDDAIVVATDLSAIPEVVRMFRNLGVAITDTDPLDACRPFQHGSRGFTFGEASVATVLTGRQDGNAYANILGGSMSHDGYHVTSVDPEIHQVRRCVDDALTASQISASRVRYLNAHGPGTKQCDRAEGLIAATLPQAEVWSVKPLAGHCQAAAGSVELAASLLAYERGEIPASPQVAASTVPLLDGRTRIDATGITLKTSLGMGGHNAAIVLAPAHKS